MVATSLRHKRSAMGPFSPPFPTSSDTVIHETAEGHRSSGESQIPSDGYSSLFTSGFLRQPLGSPSSHHHSRPTIVRGPFHPLPSSPEKSPYHSPDKHLLCPSNQVSPTKTPVRRRRSSILHTSSMSASPRVNKVGGLDGGVERALDNVMRSLKVMAMGTPRRDVPESRWSSSSEESLGCSEESGFWRTRKSGESTRSKVTLGTMKSSRSIRSKKSRKSEDTDRMEIDEEIPPVPIPTTPGRSRRMMNGLVKRLGLTPKKNKSSQVEIPELPPGLPRPPSERDLPRKSSLSTLRSALTKKSSTGTLRSVKSARSLAHPFMGSGPTFDCESNPPPLPRWNDESYAESCFPIPTTPRGRRTPKSSIGPPRLQPSTSPTTFLKDMPRRAPGTPKRESAEMPDMPPMPDLIQDTTLDSDIGTPRTESSSQRGTPALSTPSTYTRQGTPYLDTPVHPDDHDAVEIISFGTPLTARSAVAAVAKPKRLVNLLPRQQRLNLGLQTPPPSEIRTKKSFQEVSSVLRSTPLGEKNTNIPYMNTPDSLRGSSRDPLGIFRRFDKSQPSTLAQESLPFRSGGGDGWGTPMSETSKSDKTSYFDHPRTFGTPPPPFKRRPVPDFTVSPDKASVRRDSVTSLNTNETHLPSEEWELEAYLNQLDRVDREREVGVGK